MTESANITFIIPTYNEEDFLPQSLKAIELFAVDLSYEVIVVDNGSTDATLDIAQRFGATVYQDSTKTVGGLRNLGAAYADGEVLVFLDADVVITRVWAQEFNDLCIRIEGDNRLITGSRCNIGRNSSWIEKNWFLPMTQQKSGYINSGHMIVARCVFQEIGGFDDTLVTGEDWEFCMRAKQNSCSVVNNPKLLVVHEGYPKDLRSFVNREAWHGVQDFYNLQSLLRSKVALVAILYWITGILGIALAIYYMSLGWFFIALGFNALICLCATFNKRRQYRLNILPYFLLFHVYFYSRGLSVIRRLTKRLYRPRR